MQPTRRVLSRVLMLALSLALVAGVIVASRPASAISRQADPLADAAAAALTRLGERRPVQAAVAAKVLTVQDPVAVAVEARYVLARRAVAALAAPRASVDPLALDAAWAATTDQRMVAVLAALSQVGVPYRGYRAVPGVGFDCSGLTTWAWGMAGVSLPRNSSAQIRSTTPRPLDQVQPGDLVQYPGHVMMALGFGNAIVHAPRTGKTVEVRAWHKARRAGSPV